MAANKPNGPASAQVNVAMLASTISAILGAGAVSQVANAQEELEQITVTGSRIVRRDLTAPSPVMTIDTGQLETSSTIGLESVLNQMPQFVPAETQFDTDGTEASAFNTPGIASLNLRGLGSNRNLVLIDGRRGQPANATLVVDINTIPSAAIERVETITGGASAVYGADALAGVVNFILKDDFEGVEMDFQTGITAEGDGAETRFSSLIGMNAAGGRGNVMLGVDWTRRDNVLEFDREFYRDGFYDTGTQTGGFLQMAGFSARSNSPSQAVVDQIFQDRYGIAPGTISNTNEFYFNPDGSVFVLGGGQGYQGPLYRTSVEGDGFTGVRVQPNGDLAQDFVGGNISSPLERRSAFGRATYDMTDNVSAFVQANYSSVEVKQVAGFIPAITVWQASIPTDGREIPSDLEALLASRPDPNADWNLFRGMDFLGAESTETGTEVYQVMAGVEGQLTSRDWTWEAYVSTGETSSLQVGSGFGSLQRYRYLVAQQNWGTGTFTEGRNFTVECPTGLPIFAGQPAAAPSCLEAIEAKLKQLTELSQDIAEANIQGGIVDMPAGELRFAAGVSSRRNTFRFEPAEILDNVSVIENPIGLFASNNSAGETEVSEIYGELLVPVTSRLDLELGYRYSDYDTAGGVDTWKSLFNWAATDRLSMRGGFQFATRAPNTAELFTGDTLDVVDFPLNDPCQYTTDAPWGNVPENPDQQQVQDLCRAIIGNDTSDFDNAPPCEVNPAGGPDCHVRPGAPFFPLEIEIVQGNPELGTEEADTWTFGFVLNGPGRLENLVASVDFYNIEIEGAIAPLNSQFVYSKCFNADGVSNPDYGLDDPGGFCSLIMRNPDTGQRASVDAPFSNSGVLETAGVDVSVNWTTDIGPGSLYVNSQANILDRFETQDNPEAPIIDNAGAFDADGGHYDYRLFTTVGYNFGNSTLGVNWRHLPSIEDESAPRAAVDNNETRFQGAPSYDVFNLFARHSLTDRVEFRGGIDNLLDEEPPVVGRDPVGTANSLPDNNLGTTRPEFYDVLGRRYYVGFKMTF